MRYIKRSAEEELNELSKSRAAVLVAGPRQVGKTTLLEKYTDGIDFVSLSNSTLAEFANNHGHTFLETYRPPIFIDEVQNAPNIFEAIKLCVDTEKKKGLFYLCGSQQIDVMKGVTESLAGRIGLINLQGLSLRELYETGVSTPFAPTEEYFNLRHENVPTISYDDVWEIIHRGSMPELCVDETQDWGKFYEDYLSTYIERDVKEIINVRNNTKFGDFLMALAARCGQILNVAALAQSTGVNVQTAESWLSVLINTKIIYLLKPYHNNLLKRLTKTPKVIFLDTGLCAYLCEMMTPKQIQTSSMRGAIFENFVISEIVKSYYNKGYLNPPLFY
ncbi:MAG: ATP-binding protein, partial [Clostridia bacterium]|nr:ATP-binding protein [Clostridia bacterium]